MQTDLTVVNSEGTDHKEHTGGAHTQHHMHTRAHTHTYPNSHMYIPLSVTPTTHFIINPSEKFLGIITQFGLVEYLSEEQVFLFDRLTSVKLSHLIKEHIMPAQVRYIVAMTLYTCLRIHSISI